MCDSFTLAAWGCHAEPFLEEHGKIGKFMLKCEGLLCLDMEQNGISGAMMEDVPQPLLPPLTSVGFGWPLPAPKYLDTTALRDFRVKRQRGV